MKPNPTYRINGFDQIKAFYSWIFNNQDKEVSTTHVSLYLFLVNQNNRSNWVEWFKCPYDLGMAGSCIGSRNTYYKCLDDLQSWGLIEHKKGVNNYKAPLIKLCLLKSEQLTEQAVVPLCEQLTEQAVVPLSEPLTEHIYKLLTNNLKLITDNLEEVLIFLKSKNPNPEERDKKNIKPIDPKMQEYEEKARLWNLEEERTQPDPERRTHWTAERVKHDEEYTAETIRFLEASEARQAERKKAGLDRELPSFEVWTAQEKAKSKKKNNNQDNDEIL